MWSFKIIIQIDVLWHIFSRTPNRTATYDDYDKKNFLSLSFAHNKVKSYLKKHSDFFCHFYKSFYKWLHTEVYVSWKFKVEKIKKATSEMLWLYRVAILVFCSISLFFIEKLHNKQNNKLNSVPKCYLYPFTKWRHYIFLLWHLSTCSWHQKTNSPILQFTNLKCCIKAKEPFETPF